MPPETVLQFGTGKFLRAFADLFLHELSDSASAAGRVVVVQSTGCDRAAAFNRQGGRYHVAVRGLAQGRRVDRVVEVASVSRALVAADQWAEVLASARSPELETVISNVTEAGYRLEDEGPPGESAPRSFPAKLLAVLAARFGAGLPGITILPCELLEQNGPRLLDLVLQQARQWQLDEPLVEWLRGSCRWASTLVDRIVSSPSPGEPLAASDPLFAVAEPFALWLVEDSAAPAGLAAHPAVRTVERLAPYYLRKVRILNGAHTALVAKALPMGLQTVRAAVEHPVVRPWLEALLFEEIVPVLEGRTEEPAQFARWTLERFANPFLEHRLADIALHHEVKLRSRLWPTLEEYRRHFGRPPRLLGEILKSTGPA